MSDEIKDVKHCPFCGRLWMSVTSSSENRFSVRCSCGARGPEKDNKDEAINAWNIRDQHHLWNPFRFSVRFPRYKFSKGFRGNLESINIVSLLDLMASENKTGILQLTQGKTKFVICFKDGDIVAASDNRGSMKMGKILRDKGILSDEDLQEALYIARDSDKRLGEVLLSKGYIDQDTLKEILRQQIQDSLLEIFFWEEGDFEYRDCSVRFDEDGINGIEAISHITKSSRKTVVQPAHSNHPIN